MKKFWKFAAFVMIAGGALFAATTKKTFKTYTVTVAAEDVTAPDNGQVNVLVEASQGNPSGAVTLYVDGKPAGDALITGYSTQGKAQFTLKRPRVGNHSLKAVFTPNGNFAEATGELQGGLTVYRVGQFRPLKTASAPVSGLRLMAVAAAEPTPPTMSHKRRNHSATLLNDGRILVIGGRAVDGFWPGEGTLGTQQSAEIFDPKTETFTTVGSMDFYSMRSGHEAVLLNDGRVAVIGGAGVYGKGNVYIEFFDPTTNQFTKSALHPELGGWRGLAVFPFRDSNKLLLVGGVAMKITAPPTRELVSALLYDVDTDTLLQTNCPQLVGASAAQLSDGRVVLVGGSESYPNQVSTNKIWTFTPEAGCQLMPFTLHEGRLNHGVHVSSDGTIVYVQGGLKVDLNATENRVLALQSVEAIDFAQGTVTVVDTPEQQALLPAGLANFSAANLQDGTSLAVGGSVGNDPVLVESAIISGSDRSASAQQVVVDETAQDAGYTPASMVAARVGYSSTTTLDGRVVIIGGEPGDAQPAPGAQPVLSPGTAEIYEPQSGLYIALSQVLATVNQPFAFDVLDNTGAKVSDAVVTSDGATVLPAADGGFTLTITNLNAQYVEITAVSGNKTAKTRVRVKQ